MQLTRPASTSCSRPCSPWAIACAGSWHRGHPGRVLRHRRRRAQCPEGPRRSWQHGCRQLPGSRGDRRSYLHVVQHSNAWTREGGVVSGSSGSELRVMCGPWPGRDTVDVMCIPSMSQSGSALSLSCQPWLFVLTYGPARVDSYQWRGGHVSFLRGAHRLRRLGGMAALIVGARLVFSPWTSASNAAAMKIHIGAWSSLIWPARAMAHPR